MKPLVLPIVDHYRPTQFTCCSHCRVTCVMCLRAVEAGGCHSLQVQVIGIEISHGHDSSETCGVEDFQGTFHRCLEQLRVSCVNSQGVQELVDPDLVFLVNLLGAHLLNAICGQIVTFCVDQKMPAEDGYHLVVRPSRIWRSFIFATLFEGCQRPILNLIESTICANEGRQLTHTRLSHCT